MTHKACHFGVTVKNRSNCTSIVSAAAYRAGASYRDERTGLRKSFRSKRDVVSVEMIRGPDDIEAFWNTADAAETRVNSRLAREILIALPYELPLDTQRKLVRGFCLWLHDEYRLTSMACIHHPFAGGWDKEILDDLMPSTEGADRQQKMVRKNDRGNAKNHHVHILTPTREWIASEQKFGKKLRDLDDLKSGPIIIQRCRDEWETRVNVQLKKHGVKERVDLRSYKAMAKAGDAPNGLAAQPKQGARNTARSRKFAAEHGYDSTHIGRKRGRTRAQNDLLWSSWLLLRALEREKARKERSQELATDREAMRRVEAALKDKELQEAKTRQDIAIALESSAHIDCLDPYAQACAWAKGTYGEKIDVEFGRTINPEVDDATGSDDPKRSRIRVRHRVRGQSQRVRS